jgi:curved DNA-binding protein CbpA
MTGPFGVLGLPASPELTDDEVRAAWRRVAAATHPDRADGGDPVAFAAAAAAYTLLRTPAGRAEALADLRAGVRAGGPRARGRVPIQMRAWRLALRALAVLAASGVAVAAVGWQPASAAVMTGALTWLILTGRGDLGPRRP